LQQLYLAMARELSQEGVKNVSKKMDIPMNAEVICADGVYGRSTRVILNPDDKKIIGVVVRDENTPHTEFIVPINLVTETTPSEIRLGCARQAVSEMEEFNAIEHIHEETPEYKDTKFKLWPHRQSETRQKRYIKLQYEGVPLRELALHKDAKVKSKDGYVIGHIRDFLVNSKNGRITHIVLRDGHLWGQKDITIDMSYVERIEEKTMYLKLEQFYVDKLAKVPVKRPLDQESETQ